MVSKDTEQDLVLAPMAYWHMFLKPKLEKLLRKKLPQNRAVRCDETNVIVSVTGRSERDLTKRFDDIDIDWSIVEKQLLAWEELFRSGKKLRVDLSFNYLDHSSSANTSARGSKRGSSATQQMLSERAAQLDAEEESSGQPSIWREVYALMQCPGQATASGHTTPISTVPTVESFLIQLQHHPLPPYHCLFVTSERLAYVRCAQYAQSMLLAGQALE
jgi:hypothetical protein